MNVLAIVTSVIVISGFFVHSVIGGRELREIAPENGAGEARVVWVQAMSGWHWVSLDLLLAGSVLLVIGLTDLIPHEETVLLLISVYFTLNALGWLMAVTIAGRGVPRRFVKLGQWMFCLLVALLAFSAR